ncbi:MAG: DUF1737 domain-containing protein [Sphingobacteriales bacterium]|nr:MAG: DUF1737 domain-containing protein [Sphingobacteriales bacterium]
MEYNVIETTDHAGFISAIQQALKDGWELHGHLIAFPNYTSDGQVEATRYIQALTRNQFRNQTRQVQQFI